MQLSAPIDCPQFNHSQCACPRRTPTLSSSLSPCRLLRLIPFVFLSLFAASCCEGILGRRWWFSVASTSVIGLSCAWEHQKEIRLRLRLSLALQTGEAAFLLSGHCMFFALSGSLHERNLTRGFIGSRGSIGLQQHSRRTLGLLRQLHTHPASFSCELRGSH